MSQTTEPARLKITYAVEGNTTVAQKTFLLNHGQEGMFEILLRRAFGVPANLAVSLVLDGDMIFYPINLIDLEEARRAKTIELQTMVMPAQSVAPIAVSSSTISNQNNAQFMVTEDFQPDAFAQKYQSGIRNNKNNDTSQHVAHSDTVSPANPTIQLYTAAVAVAAANATSSNSVSASTTSNNNASATTKKSIARKPKTKTSLDTDHNNNTATTTKTPQVAEIADTNTNTNLISHTANMNANSINHSTNNLDSSNFNNSREDRRRNNRGLDHRRSYLKEEKILVMWLKDCGRSADEIAQMTQVSKSNVEKWCSDKTRDKVLAKFRQTAISSKGMNHTDTENNRTDLEVLSSSVDQATGGLHFLASDKFAMQSALLFLLDRLKTLSSESNMVIDEDVLFAAADLTRPTSNTNNGHIVPTHYTTNTNMQITAHMNGSHNGIHATNIGTKRGFDQLMTNNTISTNHNNGSNNVNINQTFYYPPQYALPPQSLDISSQMQQLLPPNKRINNNTNNSNAAVTNNNNTNQMYKNYSAIDNNTHNLNNGNNNRFSEDDDDSDDYDDEENAKQMLEQMLRNRRVSLGFTTANNNNNNNSNRINHNSGIHSNNISSTTNRPWSSLEVLSAAVPVDDDTTNTNTNNNTANNTTGNTSLFVPPLVPLRGISQMSQLSQLSQNSSAAAAVAGTQQPQQLAELSMSLSQASQMGRFEDVRMEYTDQLAWDSALLKQNHTSNSSNSNIVNSETAKNVNSSNNDDNNHSGFARHSLAEGSSVSTGASLQAVRPILPNTQFLLIHRPQLLAQQSEEDRAVMSLLGE